MVRNGKAMMIGKQPHPYRWVAVEDYGRMVATAYGKPEVRNQIFSFRKPSSDPSPAE